MLNGVLPRDEGVHLLIGGGEGMPLELFHHLTSSEQIVGALYQWVEVHGNPLEFVCNKPIANAVPLLRKKLKKLVGCQGFPDITVVPGQILWLSQTQGALAILDLFQSHPHFHLGVMSKAAAAAINGFTGEAVSSLLNLLTDWDLSPRDAFRAVVFVIAAGCATGRVAEAVDRAWPMLSGSAFPRVTKAIFAKELAEALNSVPLCALPRRPLPCTHCNLESHTPQDCINPRQPPPPANGGGRGNRSRRRRRRRQLRRSGQSAQFRPSAAQIAPAKPGSARAARETAAALPSLMDLVLPVGFPRGAPVAPLFDARRCLPLFGNLNPNHPPTCTYEDKTFMNRFFVVLDSGTVESRVPGRILPDLSVALGTHNVHTDGVGNQTFASFSLHGQAGFQIRVRAVIDYHTESRLILLSRRTYEGLGISLLPPGPGGPAALIPAPGNVKFHVPLVEAPQDFPE